jgi:hypothetical protein
VQSFLWPYYLTWMWIYRKILGSYPLLGDRRYQLLWMKVDGFTAKEHQVSITRNECFKHLFCPNQHNIRISYIGHFDYLI